MHFTWLTYACTFAWTCSQAIADTTTTPVTTIVGDAVDWILASPNGEKVAVAIRGTRGVTVFANGQEIGVYRAALCPQFSPNSDSFAFVGVGETSASYIVNEEKLPPLHIPSVSLRNTGPLAFSLGQGSTFNHDGTLFVYRSGLEAHDVSRSRIITGVKQAMFVNGQAEEGHDFVGIPFFKPATNELFYTVKDGFYTTLNREAPSDKYVGMWDPVVFSSNGAHWACAAQKEADQWVALVNGKPQGSSYNMVSSVTLSSDGSRLAFVAGQFASNEQFVVVDGVADTIKGNIIGVSFSNQGTSYGYAVSTGTGSAVATSMVINGKAVKTYANAQLFTPLWITEKQFAYGLWAGARSCWIINEQREDDYARVGKLVISKDGAQWGYWAISGLSAEHVITLKGASVGAYLAASDPHFNDANNFSFYTAAVADQKVIISRVVISQ